MVVGHVAPEAAVGSTIALVKEGDTITIKDLEFLILYILHWAYAIQLYSSLSVESSLS
ncbi:MAG: hypothetical protein F6K41_19560 [Symploca sp. SIO3E6]|nr:hypothetical protein [Caldora sp. SIO3E6]